MRKGSWRLLLVTGVLGLGLGDPGRAAGPPADRGGSLGKKEFFKPELYISSSSEQLEDLLGSLPNREAREAALAALEHAGRAPLRVFVDPRSGTASNVIGAFPLIPGSGMDNDVRVEDLSARVGRNLRSVDAAAVGTVVSGFAREHARALGIDAAQLGEARAFEIHPQLWQVSIPQTYKGVSVRYGRLAATLNHGNLVLIGTETWGDVRGLSTNPRLTAGEALAAGFAHADGRAAGDEVVRQPALEIFPVAPREHQRGEGFGGPVGAGYRHRLVWTFAFRRPPGQETWEVIVDAHDGEVLAFQDINQYAAKSITGGVYPMTNTGVCPTPQTCGTMQANWPMPYAYTGFSGLSFTTNGAGLYDFPGGTATADLSGFFVKIADACGPVANSSTSSPFGTISLGGTNGQTDCTSGGGSAGNTAASRTVFYETNKLAEMARGWLPSNTWLSEQLQANVNINQTCNAYWDGSTINFYRSGGGCRNAGEIASLIDHEWGHGLDQNDGGPYSNSSEAYADIAAIYRLQSSCLFHGLFSSINWGCGTTADGQGYNIDEGQTGTPHCNLNCSGYRDADWAKHADLTPDTALGFVCSQCSAGPGPCGRQVHCAGTPARQAAWDFAARDLQAAPFSLDSQTAFLRANRIFYQGSGNIGNWNECTCGSSSSGCAAGNAYMQWLAADDDDGNLANGTPHMTALYNAFNRHGIACSTPTPVNSGCAGGPATAPTLTATAAVNNSVSLSWNSVSGATRYWVFRSEGHAGCNFGKTKIAEVTFGTTFNDIEVANGRSYYYNVVAVGSSDACQSRASSCLTVTPQADATCRPLTLTHTGPGANPTASPANSNGCPTGQYRFDEFIQLTAAPSSGYVAGSWTGTNKDDTVSSVNSVDMPAAGHVAAAHYVQPTVYASYDLQSDPGLTLTGLWHRTSACQASASGHSLPMALYYGVDAQCTYDTGATNTGTATFPVVSVPNGAQRLLLTYNYLLKTENQEFWDNATTEISADGGPYFLVARNNSTSYFGLLNDPSGGWQHEDIDLTGWATTSLQVRFGFATIDDLENAFPGFYVDDVQLRSIPACQNTNLVLTNQTVSTTQTFEACETINASTSFVVGSSGNVTFHAVDRVTLGAGFSVSAGGTFKVVVP